VGLSRAGRLRDVYRRHRRSGLVGFDHGVVRRPARVRVPEEGTAGANANANSDTDTDTYANTRTDTNPYANTEAHDDADTEAHDDLG
jgi:hypothetical protein